MAERLPNFIFGAIYRSKSGRAEANHQHPLSRPKAVTHRTMNDIHATILETFFFGYIDRNIGADETPLFTRTHEGEPLSDVIARRFQLTQDEAEAAIEAARQEVAL